MPKNPIIGCSNHTNLNVHRLLSPLMNASFTNLMRKFKAQHVTPIKSCEIAAVGANFTAAIYFFDRILVLPYSV